MLCGEINAEPTSGKVSDQTISGDIIFEVPLNLTRLSPLLSKMAVTCMVAPSIDFTLPIDPRLQTFQIDPSDLSPFGSGKGVLFKRMEFPVSGGQVVGTLEVVIAVPTTPVYQSGQKLAYQCALTALSSEPKAGSGWQPFSQKAPVASLQVSPVPVPINGTFTW